MKYHYLSYYGSADRNNILFTGLNYDYDIGLAKTKW